MRILHIITTIDVGGAEMQLLALAAQQVVKGNSVTVLPVKGNSDLVSRFRDVGVEVDLSIVNRNPIKQYLWLRKFLMKTEFDVLHAHLPRAQVLAVYANRDFRRTVISRHDAMQFISNFPPWLSKLVWKSVRKRSKHTIVISSAIRERMLERGEIERETDVNVIHYGIPAAFSTLGTGMEQNWPPSIAAERGNLFVFGSVSRLVREKNLQTLIKAFSLVRKKNASTVLVIVGYGPLESKLRALARELEVDNYVYFLGKQVNIYGLLTKMDSFILPSRTEGFGLVLIEAMSAKLPIVASKVDAIPEVLGQHCGLLFDPDDLDELVRLMLLTTDSKVNQSLRVASSTRAKEFSIDESERKIMRVYQDSVRRDI